MKIRALAAVALSFALVGSLSGCIPNPSDPLTIYNADDLRNNIVTITLNGALVINTDSLERESYTAEIADPSIAEFVPGKADSNNPGFEPLAVGETKITLANEQGGIQDVVFTLKVTE